MIQLKDVCKFYQVGDDRVRALDHATLHIRPHEFVSIIGPSGSGKSTMMNIIGCLDVADAGQYLLDGLPIESYTENQLAKIRNEKIGFVFQQYNLIQKLTAEENDTRLPVWRWITSPFEALLFGSNSSNMIMIMALLLVLGGTFKVLEESGGLVSLVRVIMGKLQSRRFAAISNRMAM